MEDNKLQNSSSAYPKSSNHQPDPKSIADASSNGKLLVDKLVIAPEYFQGAASKSQILPDTKKQHSMSPQAGTSTNNQNNIPQHPYEE